MHAFWTVLLMPGCLIAASVTVAKTSSEHLNLRPGAAVGIWWSLALTATAVLVVVLAVDQVMWLVGGIAGQPKPDTVTFYGLMMRAIFRCLTAIDFPIVQIVFGAFAGYGWTRFFAPRPPQSTRPAGASV